MRKSLFVIVSMSLLVGARGAATTPSWATETLRFIIETPGDRVRRTRMVAIGAEVMERSSTFSDLLSRLRDRRRMLLYVQFAQLPVPPPSARTRFEVAPSGLVVGFITIDVASMEPLRLGAIVAHELAHAFEVSCLPHARTTERLRQELRSRAGGGDGGGFLETPFASAVEAAVLREWFSDAPTVSQLP